MKTFHFVVNLTNFEIVCSSRNTRDGFAHHCTILVNGEDRGIEATCFYLNRTWERYAYQSVMLKAAREQIARLIEWEREDYMAARDWQRMTAKRREEFAQYLDTECDNNALRSYVCLYEQIENYDLMTPPYPDWYGHRPRAVKLLDFVR